MWIIANWKMHGFKNQLESEMEILWSQIADTFLTDKGDSSPGIHHVIVCPPIPYLMRLEQILNEQGFASRFELGAQNLSVFEEDGAYTGEVSARMIQECGGKYVIIGHSERRTLFQEGDEVISQKIQIAVRSGLVPIVCVGEPEAVREKGQAFDWVGKQVDVVLSVLASFAYEPFFVLAYEPIWAIGTGQVARPEDAQAMHRFIRDRLVAKERALSRIPLIYGGSVKPSNVKALFEQHDVDGALVGGASRDMHAFAEIIHAAF